MNHFDKISELIDKLYQQSKGKNEKLLLLRIILQRNTLLPTLTKTFRNISDLKELFKQDSPNTSSSYYTVAGELLLNQLDDEYEDALYSLSNEQKQELIQKITSILSQQN